MCGIAFLCSAENSGQSGEERMRHALARLAHRGPDDEGIVSGEGWTCGHRRLSIIDLAASRQPMADPTGRWTLAFNGEIYNYRELRSGLESRWQFATHGDTEVLLAGLVLEGPSFLDRAEGMWAFALWDDQRRRLLLGRDRMGKKPLYFQILAGGIACASEIPALRALTPAPWHEDLDSTADYLRYGYCLPGYTAYLEVREILPAHVAEWSAEHGLRQTRYWELSPRRFAGSEEEARAELRERLRAAVGRRLVADVEVGAFLSGGVDSSLVVALTAAQHTAGLKTFTIGFADPSYDERQYAEIVARRFGTDHHVEVLPGFERADLERILREHVGQPFADSSILPTMLVSRLASRQVKVALSGDGGDELFSGYQRYQARAIMRWYLRLPAGLRATAHRALRKLPEPTAHHSRSILKKAHLFAAVAERHAAETPYVAAMTFAPSEIAALAPGIARRGHPPPGIAASVEPDDIATMMWRDALIYLPQDILVKVDRASMACGLEARAPFLDRSVVELAFSLPRRWHRRGFSGKRILREAFEDELPAAIWRRRKQGFGVPISSWLRGSLGAELKHMAQSDAGPLDAAAVGSMVDAHCAGVRDFGYRLWILYVYLLWRCSVAR